MNESHSGLLIQIVDCIIAKFVDRGRGSADECVHFEVHINYLSLSSGLLLHSIRGDLTSSHSLSRQCKLCSHVLTPSPLLSFVFSSFYSSELAHSPSLPPLLLALRPRRPSEREKQPLKIDGRTLRERAWGRGSERGAGGGRESRETRGGRSREREWK